ncbi:inositol phosphate phosphatase SopB [Saccharomonospora cyanea]|uniref:inositol phosphate phosphatase SopB n=1 Tax=Saccharomonospora cyanea TaxID=40989 RepID=UPI0003050A3C|nr:inositol phosphate phosphatase SopB [Saccharomonospora cyanea]
MPSADEHLFFTAEIVFEACWCGNEAAPAALLDIAREGITRRAREVSRRRTLTASEQVRGELNTALLKWGWVAETPVQARGHCVSVKADPELVEAVAGREQALAQQVALSWRARDRALRIEQMCALLLDPLRATASWFLDHPDNPDELVSIARQFQELRGILEAEQRGESVGGLLDELLAGADEAVRLRLSNVLRKVFSQYGRADLATRLRPGEDDEASGTEV